MLGVLLVATVTACVVGVLGTKLLSAIDRRWVTRRDAERAIAKAPGRTAGFPRLDFGPEVMSWPSQREKQAPAFQPLPWPSEHPWQTGRERELDWPSKAWDDPHFGKARAARPPAEAEAAPAPAPAAPPAREVPRVVETRVELRREEPAPAASPGLNQAEILLIARRSGLASAVDAIRKRTGMSFQDAAKVLAEMLHAQ